MKTAFLLSAFSAAVAAQNASCCAIDSNSVSSTIRASWCRAQTNTCPLLCSNGMTKENTCDQNALTYQCLCSSGNSSPNVSDYSQTLPSLQCDEWRKQCIASHPNDLNGQTFCLSYVCGSKNASSLSTAASASTTTGSGSSGAAASSSGSAASSQASSAATATRSAGAAALGVAKDYSTTGLALGLLALFGLGL